MLYIVSNVTATEVKLSGVAAAAAYFEQNDQVADDIHVYIYCCIYGKIETIAASLLGVEKKAVT